jgi:hypothetical protein
MYKGWAIKSSPCTAIFNDLLCFRDGMNWKGFPKKGSRRTVLVFTPVDGEKPRKPSVRVVDVPAEIGTNHLRNTEKLCGIITLGNVCSF